MVEIGQFNNLTIDKLVDFGAFLDGGRYGRILLPKRYLPAGKQVGDTLRVFIYLDSEDQLIATTETPKLVRGACACLKVKDVNRYGAFLDWGLPKDLMVPFKEQNKPMELGRSYVVTLYLDNQERLVASSRLSRHIPETSRYLKPQQPVSLLVCGRTELGYKVVIEGNCLGLLFRDDAFKPLKYGQQVQGYVKDVRPDGKVDVSLQLPPIQQREQLTEQIIANLRANGGHSPLTDSSAPDDIYHVYSVSKKTYKKAIGQLYKERRIEIGDDGITLLDNAR